jgi:GAF domain/PilZ domain
LSEEGMSMRTAAPLEIEQPVRVHVDLTSPTGHVETTGYIAWADALGRAGVRFSELPEDARRRLNEWLTVNADAPSSIAPKLSLRGTARAAAWSVGESKPDAEEAHVSLSLEPGAMDEDELIMEIEARQSAMRPGTISRSAVPPTVFSGTVQYEFNPLGSDLQAALRLIGERARALTRGTSAAIALAHNGSVICRASIGVSAPALGTRLDVNSGFSGECFRTGRSLRCDDAEVDGRVDVESCRRLGVRSILAAPIRSQKQVMGLLAVFGEQSFNFDEGDVAVVESLAHTVLVTLTQTGKA